MSFANNGIGIGNITSPLQQDLKSPKLKGWRLKVN